MLSVYDLWGEKSRENPKFSNNIYKLFTLFSPGRGLRGVWTTGS